MWYCKTKILLDVKFSLLVDNLACLTKREVYVILRTLKIFSSLTNGITKKNFGRSLSHPFVRELVFFT